MSGEAVHESQATNPSGDRRAGQGSQGFRSLLGPLLLLVVLVAAGRLGGHYWEQVQDHLANSGVAGLVVFWLALVGLAAACFPVSALGFSSGALFGWWPGLGLIFSAGIMSGLLMYWLGRGLFHRQVRQFIESRPRFRRLDRLAAGRVRRLNLLTRLSPLNYGLASYVLAAGRPPLRDYAVGLMATLPSILVWVWLGNLARAAAAEPEAGSRTPWWLLGVALLFFFLLFWEIGRMARKALNEDELGERSTAGKDDGFWQVTGSVPEEVQAAESAWEWDLQAGKFKISRALMDHLGYRDTSAVVPDTWVEERIHPSDITQVRSNLTDRLRRHDPGLGVEFRFRGADGSYVWLQVLAVAMWNRKGHARTLIGTVADITARVKVAEERDRLFNLSPDLLVSGDFAGNLQQVNPAWVRVLGWSRDDLLQQPLVEFAVPEDRPVVRAMLLDLANGKSIDGRESRWRTRSRETRWLSWNCLPYPGEQRFFGVARDITRRKDAEARVQQYQKQLQELSYQLSVVEDRQRQQLAVSLHDGLAQQLFAIRAQATLLKFPDRIDNAQEVVQGILELLDETMAETKSLSFQLFPPSLQDVGLEAALRWLGDQFAKRRGLAVNLACTGEEPDLPRDLRSLLFQCCRELLTNVVKHARCDQATVELEFSPEMVELVVSDEGGGSGALAAGEPDAAWDQESGFGLFSIRERLQAVGGTMSIRSEPQRGTRVSLILPLAGESAPGAGETDG